MNVQEIEGFKDKLAEEVRTEHGFGDIIGASRAWRAVLKAVETVAPSDSTVRVRGATVTLKELIARALHALSARKSRTFVQFDGAAIPTGLLESELFGHEEGAFTGAVARKVGRFEPAHQRTLSLDEIGDIPLELQLKLLRVLQEREIERLGEYQNDPRERAPGGCHELRPDEDGRGGPLPRRPGLPSECLPDRDAEYAEAAVRDAALGA